MLKLTFLTIFVDEKDYNYMLGNEKRLESIMTPFWLSVYHQMFWVDKG